MVNSGVSLGENCVTYNRIAFAENGTQFGRDGLTIKNDVGFTRQAESMISLAD